MQTITVDAGYSTTIVAEHIYNIMDTRFNSASKDADYPKFCVMIDAGGGAPLPAGRAERRITFWVVCIVKQISEEDDSPREKIEQLIEDFYRMMAERDTLNETVDTAFITDFATDSGALKKEGAAVLTIACTYHTLR
jgi:hypothetical protein